MEASDIFAREVDVTAHLIDDGFGSVADPADDARDRRDRYWELIDSYGRKQADEIWAAAEQRVREVWTYGRHRAIIEGRW